MGESGKFYQDTIKIPPGHNKDRSIRHVAKKSYYILLIKADNLLCVFVREMRSAEVSRYQTTAK